MSEPMLGFMRRHRGTALLLLFLTVVILSGQHRRPRPPDPRYPEEGMLGSCIDACEKVEYDILPLSLPHQSLPLNFEWNLGQADSRYRLLAHGKGYDVYLSGQETALHIRDAQGRGAGVVRMALANAKPAARLEPLEPRGGRVNYFRGNDPSGWITDVPTFGRVRHTSAYPGIDIEYYGEEGRLENDFVVEPGADPRAIQLEFRGADRIEVDGEGAVVLRVKNEKVVWRKPLVYQRQERGRRRVEARYRLQADGRVGFEVGVYDRAKPLVIDPVITYATYTGRNGPDAGSRMAVDAAGNTYITGGTNGEYFPRTPGALSTTASSLKGDVVITKLNANGSDLVYSTYIGGGETDLGAGIAVDAAGNVFVAGATNSEDFPVTSGAFQTNPRRGFASPADPGNCFVVKLNAAGNRMLYGTYLGGSRLDGCLAVAIDAAGNAYVTGGTESTDFPSTENAFQRVFRLGSKDLDLDAFVAKLNPDGSGLVYSTFLGGSGNDGGLAIAVDASGNAYVTGYTTSYLGFPVTGGAFQTVHGGSGGAAAKIPIGDAFVIKLNPAGTGLVYGTLLGGNRDDLAFAIAVDKQGSAYVTGSTLSPNFPTTDGAYQRTYKGAGGELDWAAGDAFVARLSPAGDRLVFSTLLGGSRDERGAGIAIDERGNAWITGNTLSRDLPVSTDARQRAYGGESAADSFHTGDAFLAQIDAAGQALLYSTYLGGAGDDWGTGVAVDSTGGIHVAGSTSSADFPVTAGAYQTKYGTAPEHFLPFGDAFLARFGEPPRLSIAAVVNAASYVGGAVAPGEIVTVTGVGIGPAALKGTELNTAGRLNSTLAETRILFDGTPAPLVYVRADQSSAIVPYAVAGKAATQVVVEYQGNRSAAVTLPVVAALPALFSANASGRGQGAILNQDSSYNTAANPAAKGSIVILFGTGEGQTNPAGADGQLASAVFPKPALPVSVTFGGLPAEEVLYAGAAPGQVAGLFQINVRIPAEVASGDVPVVVTVGTAPSQSGLTVAVQ